MGRASEDLIIRSMIELLRHVADIGVPGLGALKQRILTHYDNGLLTELLDDS